MQPLGEETPTAPWPAQHNTSGWFFPTGCMGKRSLCRQSRTTRGNGKEGAAMDGAARVFSRHPQSRDMSSPTAVAKANGKEALRLNCRAKFSRRFNSGKYLSDWSSGNCAADSPPYCRWAFCSMTKSGASLTNAGIQAPPKGGTTNGRDYEQAGLRTGGTANRRDYGSAAGFILPGRVRRESSSRHSSADCRVCRAYR